MRFLRDTLPCHKDLIYIPGFNPQNDSDKNEVRQLLNQVCEPDVVTVIVNDLRSASSSVSSNLTGTTGVILPVDLAIVGLMIEISHLFRERGKLRYREAYEVTLGGKDGLVRSYLRTCLQASPDYYVSQAVLAALSAATGLRSAVGIQKLCQVVYYRDDDVEKAIEFFEERGLVRRFATKSGEAAYEWTHDTLAAAYREFSASEMDATLRDNIMYLAERATTGKEEIQTYCALEKNIIKWRLWLSVYVLVCAGVVLRWVWPGPFDSAAVQLRQWDVVRSLFPNPTSPDDAAKLYMWVGWSHLAGGWFVYKILNLFIHVRGKYLTCHS